MPAGAKWEPSTNRHDCRDPRLCRGREPSRLHRPPILGRDHHADTGHGHEIPPVGQPCLSTAGRLARNPETLHEHRPARRRTTRRPLAVPDLTLNDGSDLPISRNAAQVVKAICAHMPNIATA
jgi:hypothetical protein